MNNLLMNLTNTLKPAALALALGALVPGVAFGWGQKGHDTVAFIAENHLTPTARSKAEALLGGKSIVYYANWLDNASHTDEYAYSKTWHYRNIDAGQDYDKAPRNKQGDVVKAIVEQSALLASDSASDVEKALALKMVVHLVGDIHQPMHMGHKSDLGGNKWNVKYFGRNANLHGIWDSNLVESAHKWSYTEWQSQIDRLSPEEEAVYTSVTDPNEWGRETYAIATRIYDTTPQDFYVEYGYIADWTPVIEEQLLKGGLRLATMLNSIFDPEAIEQK